MSSVGLALLAIFLFVVAHILSPSTASLLHFHPLPSTSLSAFPSFPLPLPLLLPRHFSLPLVLFFPLFSRNPFLCRLGIALRERTLGTFWTRASGCHVATFPCLSHSPLLTFRPSPQASTLFVHLLFFASFVPLSDFPYACRRTSKRPFFLMELGWLSKKLSGCVHTLFALFLFCYSRPSSADVCSFNSSNTASSDGTGCTHGSVAKVGLTCSFLPLFPTLFRAGTKFPLLQVHNLGC
jgi:hypothetical protein